MQSPILISLSPNTEKDDILLALKLIFKPWLWRKKGPVEELEKDFQKLLPTKHAVSFNNGRTAWLAILENLNLERESEVLLQAFTCNAVVNPIRWAGLKPVFVDIEEKTLNIDPADLERKITPASRVVLTQHTFGLAADLEKIYAVCQKHNLILIEDCAHSLGATYNKKTGLPAGALAKVGTFGQAAFFSFGRDKVISSVCGGMGVTNDNVLAQKLRDYRNDLPEPSHFWIFQQLLHPILTNLLVIPFYGLAGTGKWLLIFLQKTGLLSKAVSGKEKQGEKPVDLAKRMPAALALLAGNQLKKLDRFIAHQREIARFYDENLKNPDLILPPSTLDRIYLRYPLLLKNGHTDKILGEARKEGVFLDDGWRKAVITPPDTDQVRTGYRSGECPVAERTAQTILNLPTHINISKEKAQRIIDFLNNCHSEYDISRGLPHAMEIREINNQEIWEDFLQDCPDKTFLQSWNWGELQKALGNKTWRLGAFDDEKIVGIALVVKIAAKRGIFLLIQHGPAFAKASAGKPVEILETLLKKLKTIAAGEKASFIRIAPLWEENGPNKKAFESLGFIDSPMHANAYTATWKLDISEPENQLLAQMRKTTRYLIRQAQNNPELTVEKRTDENALGLYQELNLELAKRQNFAPFSSEFIREEFKALAPGSQAQFFLGKYKGEALAGALVIFWSGLAFYHQAASSQKCAKIPLPYLVIWEAIKEAKNRGCKTFDFWGFVDPKSQPRHPWAGPTLFKMGFGGQSHEYLKTKDLPLSKKYWLTFLFEEMRKFKRGL